MAEAAAVNDLGGGIPIESKSVTDSIGNEFEVYTTNYTHTTVDKITGKSTESEVTMMFNPNTGASLVGNVSDGYHLYIRENPNDENSRIMQYAIGGDASIDDYTYLLNWDISKSPEKNNGKSVLAYGPHGDLMCETTGDYNTNGQTTKVTIGGQEYDICTSNEGRDNYFDEFENMVLTVINTDSSNTSGSTQSETSTRGGGFGESGTGGGGFSRSGGGFGEFERGIRGEVDETSPWIPVDYAEGFRRFLELAQFSAGDGYNFDMYRERLQQIIEIIQKQGCFFTNPLTNAPQPEGGKQKTNLEEAIEKVLGYEKEKAEMSIDTFGKDIEKYNDNVEKARVQNTRKALREACQTYNEKNTIIVDEYTTTNTSIREKNRHDVYASGQDADGRTIYTVVVYDKIKYDAFSEKYDIISLWDMKNDQMVRELEQRGIPVNIEGRPENTKWYG